jgi:transcriptional regulator with XRE-family HTH domain
MSRIACNVRTQTATFSGSLLLAAVMEPKEIGQRIKAARKRKGWTQLEFALQANVSPSTIARWERGQLPTVRELIRVAELLGVDPNQLVESEPTSDDQIAAIREEVSEMREVQKAQQVMLEELLRRSASVLTRVKT